MSKLFSEETLSHYGIPGQKKGVRRWQYPDGRFNEEGKERYFGKSDKEMTKEREYKDPKSKYDIGKGLNLATRMTIQNPKTGKSEWTYIGKANRNAKKLGITESKLKSTMKLLALQGPVNTDNYNIRRSEGQGVLRAYLGARIADPFKDIFSLGKYTYDRQANRKLEHSED